MHILFTRPLEDSKDLILKFNDLGHKVSYMPVIEIQRTEHENINFKDYKALIFTSANSLTFLDTKEHCWLLLLNVTRKNTEYY